MINNTPTTSPASRYSVCLLFAANALARAVTAIGDSEFAKLGFSYSHAYLLHEVAQRPGQTPTFLSDALLLSPSTISRLVEKLELKGLVRRQTEGKNTLVFTTEKGDSLVPMVMAALQHNCTLFAEQLGEQEALNLTRLVFSAAEKLGEIE